MSDLQKNESDLAWRIILIILSSHYEIIKNYEKNVKYLTYLNKIINKY